MKKIRKWSRPLHRDLSFFFSGVIIIYTVSGLMLNHKATFNSDYSVKRHEIKLALPVHEKESVNKEFILSILEPLGEELRYTHHYFPSDGQLKVFLKGGSSVIVDTASGEGIYESVRKRPVLSSFNRLHYNPSRWWTVFSDIFAVALFIITLTGLVMVKGTKGVWGRGGIFLAMGIIIPLLFIFIS